MNFEEAYNTKIIQLEPRLQEYIRRKKFNQENDIKPNIPEEQEFCITNDDRKIIKKHKNGKSKIYTGKKLSKQSYFIKPGFSDFDLKHDFKKDPRYERIKKKLDSHKKARQQITNFDKIDEEYDIFHRSNPYDLRLDKRPSRVSKPYEEQINDELSYDDNTYMMDSRDLMLNSNEAMKYGNINRGKYCYNPNRKMKNQSSYHHTPKISYRQRLQPQTIRGGLEHSRDLNDIIGNIDNYNKHLNNTYEYISGGADVDTHTYIPDTRTKTQRGTYNKYQSVPFQYGNGLPDVSVEDALRGGFKDTSKKSAGFRNPFEHQFDYISQDISDPNHSVQMWPQNSRGQNKEISRPKSKAVQSDKRLKRRGPYNDKTFINY